nr:hypothetical protein [Tanacetum cinerariifolium]GEW02495.1 hypothetical protein [Tanacetum cinerariifolium]
MEYKKNMISNEFVVKLCLEYKVKNSEKVVKRELLVALKGEIYFAKLIINLEEDDIESWVIFGCSILRITKGIVDFGSGILTIYPDLITYNDDSNDVLDALLASIDVDDLPPLDIADIIPFVCNMGKSARNKKQPLKTYKISYNGIVHQKFYVANVKNAYAKSDSDDDKEYCLKRYEMGKPIYGPNHAKYLSCDNPLDRALAIQEAFNPFKKICVWKKAVAFLGALLVPPQNAELLEHMTMKRVLFDPKEPMTTKTTYNTNLARLLPKQIYSPCIVDWNVLNTLGCAKAIEEMLEIKDRSHEVTPGYAGEDVP